MENYRTGSHTRFDIKYHFVWVTKYRKAVLRGEVGVRLRDLVREVCRTHEIEILQGSVSCDHVHVLLSCPPNLSPSKVMQYIKGKSSRKLMMEFKHIQKQYWGRHLWARGYFVASSGNVTDAVIMEYIRQQEGTEPGDGGENFQVAHETPNLPASAGSSLVAIGGPIMWGWKTVERLIEPGVPFEDAKRRFTDEGFQIRVSNPGHAIFRNPATASPWKALAPKAEEIAFELALAETDGGLYVQLRYDTFVLFDTGDLDGIADWVVDVLTSNPALDETQAAR